MSALDTALDLAARHGLAVFPLGADKRPVCAHGFLDASTDEATIRVLFATDAAVLVGVATGAINGFDVLDVDRHKEAGEAWIKENAHRIPVTARIQKTRRGGWHCFFRHHPGLHSSTDCPAKGVDIRGDGGYVVWWEGHLGCELINRGEPAGCEWPEELLQKVLARRSYQGTSQPKNPEELSPPDAASLLSLLRSMPNPEDATRDDYVATMLAVQGAIRGLAALHRATPEELEDCAAAACEWAARWNSPRASSFEAEREKWGADFSQRANDVSGWRQVLAIARRLGFDTVAYDLAEAANDFGPLPPEPAPKVKFIDPWERVIPPEFPIDVLPESLRSVVTDTSDMVGCCIGSASMVYLAAVAGAVHGRTCVRVKRHDDNWYEKAILWVALTADPSSRKSPLIRRAVTPIERYEDVLLDTYFLAKAAWDAEDKRERGPEPKATSFMLSDTTPEKVADLLSVHDRGALMYVDELSGFIASMERYGSAKGAGGAARGFWLEAYDGGRKRHDRIGRGTGRVKNLAVGIVGGIQVDKIAKLAKNGELTDDGFLQRFIPVLMDPPKRDLDRPPSPATRWYAGHITELLKCGAMEFELDEQGYRLKEAAFDDYLAVSAGAEFGKGFQGAMGKAGAQLMRLVLTLHMADPETLARGDRLIPASTVAKGVKLMEYVKRSQAAFYTVIGYGTAAEKTQALASYVLRHDGDTIKLRDFKQNVRALKELSEKESLDQISLLAAVGWLEPADTHYPCKMWAIARGLKEHFAKHTEVLKAQAAERLSLIRTEATIRREQRAA